MSNQSEPIVQKLSKDSVPSTGLRVSLLFLGSLIGYLLSSVQRLRQDELMNLAGLIYALLGVVVLAEIVSTDPWKATWVNHLAPRILWVQEYTPVAMLIGAGMGFVLHRPSAISVLLFSLFFGLWSGFGLPMLHYVIAIPKSGDEKTNVDTRWKWLGFFLVVSGIMLQLIAAVTSLDR